MRVAFVSAATPFHRDDDRTRRVGNVADRLAARGHDVHVCCSRWWSGTLGTLATDAITYHAVAGRADGALDVRGFARRLPRRLRAIDPDVVHVVHDYPLHVVAAGVGGRVAGAPVVLDWYDLGVADVRTHLTRWALRVPSRVVAPSRTVATRVRELGGDAGRLDVVPNGVEFDLIGDVDPVACGDVVYSRRLDDDANLESLLLALAEFREYDWTATVIGDGPRRAAYERQARDLRIDDRVEFVGALSVEERLRRFKAAHVYVHTAQPAPFPTDLCRALACGCVGVVEYHAESSAHELVEQHPRGYLATDDGELVDHIGAAAERSRRDVDDSLATYGHEQVVDRLVECFREAGVPGE